ncbi:MAG TPA: dihydrolipoamide acetyltransferase family protein [Alphaproteobacteria bacterium]|nr:dihydrolipoamide acetyltransferase family protein [Alphaproteobacteria bacterium]
MAREFKLQDPGEGIHEVEIQEILVGEGEKIDEGQNVFVVESDKAAIEVPSPFSGTVSEIRVKEGQIAEVGDVLLTVDTGEEEMAKGGRAGKGKPTKGSKEEREDSAKEEQEAGEKEQPKVEVKEKETEKKQPVEENKEEKAEEEEKDRAAPKGDGRKQADAKKHEKRGVEASPAARHAAKQRGIDLSEIEGTGSRGHVTKEDVERAAGGAEAKPGPERKGRTERRPLRSVRRATARQMSRAWAEIPHVTHQDSADVTGIEVARQELIRNLGEGAPKVTLTAFAIKALGVALQRHPGFNAEIDTDAEEIILHKRYDVALAVDSPRGLVTPVLRDVDRKSILEIAAEARRLSEKVHQGRAGKSELQGGTFTVTNVGSLGGTAFSPMINYPQSAILGMARARLEQVITGSADQPDSRVRLMLPLMLAFDHRIVDGADAARFMNDLKELLSDPTRLLVELR